MDVDISIGSESLTIRINNPHRFDVSGTIKNIVDFGFKSGVDLASLRMESLILRMIRGVAGCESGCPADARSLAGEGFGGFNISYIEGGILSASRTFQDGRSVEVRVFPEFA